MNCNICQIGITKETRARQKYNRCVPCYLQTEKVKNKRNSNIDKFFVYNCDCGCIITFRGRHGHFKTEKHIKLMNNINVLDV